MTHAPTTAAFGKHPLANAGAEAPVSQQRSCYQMPKSVYKYTDFRTFKLILEGGLRMTDASFYRTDTGNGRDEYEGKHNAISERLRLRIIQEFQGELKQEDLCKSRLKSYIFNSSEIRPSRAGSDYLIRRFGGGQPIVLEISPSVLLETLRCPRFGGLEQPVASTLRYHKPRCYECFRRYFHQEDQKQILSCPLCQERTPAKVHCSEHERFKKHLERLREDFSGSWAFVAHAFFKLAGTAEHPKRYQLEEEFRLAVLGGDGRSHIYLPYRSPHAESIVQAIHAPRRLVGDVRELLKERGQGALEVLPLRSRHRMRRWSVVGSTGMAAKIRNNRSP